MDSKEDGTKWIGVDQVYPIYTLIMKWKQDERDRKTGDLTGKRIDNSISINKLEIKELSDHDVTKWMGDFKIQYFSDDADENRKKNSRGSISGVTDLDVSVNLKGWESWNLSWFTHETPIIPTMSDQDYLDSFERYVQRHEDYQDIDFDRQKEMRDSGEIPFYTSLMGAEDRWRWRGATEDSTAPCRCENCIKSGFVRISH